MNTAITVIIVFGIIFTFEISLFLVITIALLWYDNYLDR